MYIHILKPSVLTRLLSYTRSRLFLQVSDNYVGLDLLGSQLDLRVANFRKINIKTIPVYGMAQPTNDVSEVPCVETWSSCFVKYEKYY